MGKSSTKSFVANANFLLRHSDMYNALPSRLAQIVIDFQCFIICLLSLSPHNILFVLFVSCVSEPSHPFDLFLHFARCSINDLHLFRNSKSLRKTSLLHMSNHCLGGANFVSNS